MYILLLASIALFILATPMIGSVLAPVRRFFGGAASLPEELPIDRAAWHKALLVARQKKRTEGPALTKRLQEHRDEYLRVEAELRKRLGAIEDAERADSAKVHALDRAEAVAEMALIRSASPLVDDFLAQLTAETDATRNASNSYVSDEWLDKGSSWERKRKAGSNHAARDSRLAALREARDLALSLKVLPLNDAELTEQLAKIAAGIPPASTLDTMTVVAA